MKKPPRRSNVVALSGEYSDPVITQVQLAELELAQRSAWAAHVKAVELAKNIQLALKQGAKVEPGRLYFDELIEMARSRRRKGA